ncbi:MAG: hypothetical protein AAF125_01540 [Chloroflexota bacterium]
MTYETAYFTSPNVMITRYRGLVTEQLLRKVYAADGVYVNSLSNQDHIYRISYVIGATTTYAELRKIAAMNAEKKPGHPSDPRITAMFVGTAAIVKVASNVVGQPQYGNNRMAIYSTLSGAYAFIQQNLNLSAIPEALTRLLDENDMLRLDFMTLQGDNDNGTD